MEVINLVVALGIALLVCVIWSRFSHYLLKKRVLTAIKDLDIEEDLANCVVGLDARSDLAIRHYFINHGWDNPFEGSVGHFGLCCILNELRTEGKLKPVYDNLMSMKKKSDGHKNAVMLRQAKETDIRSRLEDYIARWRFKEGVEIDMFNLIQRRLDELHNIYALINDVTVTPENLFYNWNKSEKYYVTILGHVLLVDYDKMREMAIDLECTCGSLYKLNALPESYVNEHLHDNERRNDVV